MISIIIPSSKDPYLQKTIDSLLENAQGDIEIIPVLDGFLPSPPLKKDVRVKPEILPMSFGMRAAINAGLAKATGKFIMKCDSHCLFGPNYDTLMAENCAEDWLMIPRRFPLDVDNWQKQPHRVATDYHYLSFPTITKYGVGISNQPWQKKSELDVDDTMSFQGSCWLAHIKYFMRQVGFLDDRQETYGPFADEPQEIGLKYWLGGGANKVIKTAWYAHLSKRLHHYRQGLYSREYKLNLDAVNGRTWSAKHWLGNEEPGMIHPFSWLVEKFWPVPTWPEDRSLWVFPKS